MVSRKRKTVRKAGVVRATLTVTHPNAAGIDLGSGSHFVAVPPDRVEESVKEFSSFTVDLHALADWLTSCGVDTVAMESTGVYWIPLFELLESRGFKVYLVNARHVKNVSGRKSDVLDLRTSHSALGAYFRRVCARMDKPKAITAAAHKLAPPDLHPPHPRPGIRRPGPGRLRSPLPGTGLARPSTTRGKAWNEGRDPARGHLKRLLKSMV